MLARVSPKSLSDLIAPDWAEALAPVEGTVHRMGEFLRAEIAAGRPYLPAGENVLRAFQQPLSSVRVLIVGQDPYPTPGHPVGLSFSVAPDVRPIPRSLANIYRELMSDLGVPAPSSGDLSPWVERGVLLLNRVLTVQPGNPGSHRNKGWEAVTEHLMPMLGEVPYIESAHPSPMSADRGFFGSRPFSRTNTLLTQAGATPLDWQLP